MPFIRDILNYGSLSIVGLEKNTGKTECLNYILNRLPLEKIRVGVSSIGIDGERSDQVTRTHKPEIYLKKGIFFTTSEKHYRQRRILSELLYIDDEHTSLGRVVTAKALARGRVMLSGPPSTQSLIKWIKNLKERYQTDICIIDGALSRLSPASPAVSEAMILSTGAALSISATELINKTNFVVQLIGIDRSLHNLPQELSNQESGVWLYNTSTGQYAPLYDSAFTLNPSEDSQSITGDLFFVTGALTDRLMNKLINIKEITQKEIVVKDFTKLFISQLTYNNFLNSGGVLSVLVKTKLIAICVNPVSPTGYTLNSQMLREELSYKTGLPVYDIFDYN